MASATTTTPATKGPPPEEMDMESMDMDDVSESSLSSSSSLTESGRKLGSLFTHTDLVAHALCFLECRSICSFACGATWATIFSYSQFASKRTSFRRHWLETVEKGDRVDAMDVEGRWSDAVSHLFFRERSIVYRPFFCLSHLLRCRRRIDSCIHSIFLEGKKEEKKEGITDSTMPDPCLCLGSRRTC